MRKYDVKFDFDDIVIVPKKITTIRSRFKDINSTYGSKLPLFTAPMDTVVDLKNFQEYTDLNINVTLPRTISYKKFTENKFFLYSYSSGVFFSLGLNEFEKWCTHNHQNINVLIDIANGHMEAIGDAIEKAKKINSNLVIMIGNVANPKTYKYYAEMGLADYIRVGIGNGSGCLTTQQTGIGYPNASLINECYLIKKELENNIDDEWDNYKKYRYSILQAKKPKLTKNDLPKIVADGGMKDYSDVIKALALGADYVMIGSIFNKAIESSGQNYLFNIKISFKFAQEMFDLGFPIKKQFYGMSTKLGQKKLKNSIFKTSEGVIRYRKAEFKLFDWIDNFNHYLKSAMSYSNARTLEEFIGKADFELITENAFKRFNK